MNDGDHDATYNERSEPVNAIVDPELQPLLDSCSSLIRRCLQYRPRSSIPSTVEPAASSIPAPWCLGIEGEGISEEERRLQEEWLCEMTRIQQEYLYLQRLRSSLLLQPPPDGPKKETTATQILRAHGRKIRDAQVTAVLHSQSILDDNAKQISALQEQIRQVQASNRRLLGCASDTVTSSAEGSAEQEASHVVDPRTLMENRLLHGIILDLLPFVLPLEEQDDGAASRLQRYL